MSSIGTDVKVGKLTVLEKVIFEPETVLNATTVYIKDRFELGEDCEIVGLNDTYATDAELAEVNDILTSNLASNVVRIETLESGLDTEKKRIDGLVTSLSTTDASIVSLNESLLEEISTVSDSLATEVLRIDSLREDVDSNSAILTQTTLDVSSNASILTQTNLDVASNAQILTNLGIEVQQDILNLASNVLLIEQLRNDVDSNASILLDVIEDVASNATLIQALRTDLDSNASILLTTNGTVSEVEASISTLGQLQSLIDGSLTDAEAAALTGTLAGTLYSVLQTYALKSSLIALEQTVNGLNFATNTAGNFFESLDDFVDEDGNDTSTALQRQVVANKLKIDEHTEQISDLNDLAQTNASDISSLRNRTNGLSTKLITEIWGQSVVDAITYTNQEELEEAIVNEPSKVDKIEGLRTDLDNNVSILTTLGEEVQQDILNLSSNVALIDGLRTDLDNNVSILTTLGEEVQQDILNLSSNVALIEGLRTDLDNNVSILTTLGEEVQQDILNLSSNVALIEALRSDVDSNSAILLSVIEDVTSNVLLLEALRTDLDSNASILVNQAGQLEDIENNLGTLNQLEALVNGELNEEGTLALSGTVAGVLGTVLTTFALKSQINTLSASLSALQSSVNAITTASDTAGSFFDSVDDFLDDDGNDTSTALQRQVIQNTNDIATHSSQIGDLQTDVSDLDTRTDGLARKIISEIWGQSVLDSLTYATQEELETAIASLDTEPSRMDSFSSSIAGAVASIATLTGASQTNDGRIDELESGVFSGGQVRTVRGQYGNGVTTAWKRIATVSGGSGIVKMEGVIGGHDYQTSGEGQSAFSLMFSGRDGFKVFGEAHGSLKGGTDLIVYYDGTNTSNYKDLTIYIKRVNYTGYTITSHETHSAVLYDDEWVISDPASSHDAVAFNLTTHLNTDTFKSFVYNGEATPVIKSVDQKLGIGVTPQAKLHVEGSSGELFRISDGTRSVYAGCDGNEPWFGTKTNHDLRLVTNSGERMRITKEGHLGIGDSSAPAPITVRVNSANPGDTQDDLIGSQDTTEVMRFYTNAEGGDVNSISTAFKTGGYYPLNSSPYGRLDVYANGGASANNAWGTTPDKLVASFRGDGRLGVNKENPDYTLDVNGTARATTLRADNAIYAKALYATNDDTSAYGVIELGGTLGAYIDLKRPSSDDFDLRLITTGEGGGIQVTGGEALSILNNKNITAHGNFTVSGTLTASSIALQSGKGIDEILTITKTLQLTTNWQDTGIQGTDLATGTHAVQIYSNDQTSGGYNYEETYSGLMSWFSGNTNSYEPTEIHLTSAGHAPNDNHIYLRLIRSGTPGKCRLQMRKDIASMTSGYTYTFKFRRLI
jgi:chromosome segregation ATPase